jgi:hypothetical protein
LKAGTPAAISARRPQLKASCRDPIGAASQDSTHNANRPVADLPAVGGTRSYRGLTGRWAQLYDMTTLSNSSAGIPPLNIGMPPRFADGHRIAPDRLERNRNAKVFHNL